MPSILPGSTLSSTDYQQARLWLTGVFGLTVGFWCLKALRIDEAVSGRFSKGYATMALVAEAALDRGLWNVHGRARGGHGSGFNESKELGWGLEFALVRSFSSPW